MKQGFFIWAALAASLGVFVFLGFSMIEASAPTYDEPVHLASGYTALKTGSRLLNGADHPPLAEMWDALPLLFLKPAVFFGHSDWINQRVYNYSDFFLYKNHVDAERLLNTARLWGLISWGILLAWGIFSWAWRLSGVPALCGAAVLFALCPPLFTNAALVTTDMASAVFFFLCLRVLAFDGSQAMGFARLTQKRCFLAGVCLGAALASKFNMFILIFFAGGMLLAEWNLRRKSNERFPAAGVLLIIGSSALVLAGVYRFIHVTWYWHGLSATLSRLSEGRASFLFGHYSTRGNLLYFPTALLIKTPLCLLLAGLFGCAALFSGESLRVPTSGQTNGSRDRILSGFWLLIPPLAYFVLAMCSKTQIGYRHILPVYPFLIVIGACGTAWLWKKTWGKVLCPILGLWLGLSVFRAHPHYLAYFNEAVGGPSRGYQYLVDSNLDWGQGLKPLAQELKRMGNPPVYLSYFGVADPAYYGIRYWPLGIVSNVDPRPGVQAPSASERLLFAISATNLQAVYYADHAAFQWLKNRKPLWVAGYSIFLYDLTLDKEGAGYLARFLQVSGQDELSLRVLKSHAKAS